MELYREGVAVSFYGPFSAYHTLLQSRYDAKLIKVINKKGIQEVCLTLVSSVRKFWVIHLHISSKATMHKVFQLTKNAIRPVSPVFGELLYHF